MAESRFIPSRYFKPSTFISLALCISAVAEARALSPGESTEVNQGDSPESWTLATGSTLTVNNGAQTLSINGGGAGSVVNLNTGSSAGSVNLSAPGAVANITGASVIASGSANALVLTDSSAILNNATVVSTNGLGLFGTQVATGPGSSFLINGGTITGSTGGASLSFGSSLDATGAVITGTSGNSYGVRGFGSDISLRDSTVTGGLNGLAYRVDVSNVRQGTINIEGSHIEGTNGAAILLNGQGGGMVANLNLLNGTTLTGGNGNALEVSNTATANVLLQSSEVTGNFAISNGSIANLTFDQGRLIGNVSADATSSGTLALNNGSALTGDVTGIDAVNLNASSITGNVTSASSAGVVSLANGSVLEGNVNSDNVSLNGSQMIGDITSMSSAGVVSLVEGSALQGNVSSDNVSLNASSMKGDITSTSNAGVVSLVGGSTVEGQVISDNVSLDASSITGDVTSASGAGAVKLVRRSLVRGNVNSNNVSLDASSIAGNVTSTGTAGVVSLAAGSLVEGNVSSNDVSLDASSIVGNVTSIGGAGLLKLLGGSTLKGDVSSSNVSLDASSMSGDITSGGGVVSLANNSVFTGNLINVDSATLAGSSTWDMVGSNTLNSLAMNDSTVRFGATNAFYQLNVGTLSGNGTFVMDADYLTNEHDLLNVTGSATGSHTLLIAGSGADPTSPQPLTVVQTGGGNATFTLAGDRAVDVGTYSYQLASASNSAGGTDWFLDPNTATISPGTRSVLALFNTAPTVWYGELTSLRSRMGELRFNGGKAGGWVRTYGNKYNVDEASGVGYQQTQQGLSLGADAPLPVGDGQWLVGVLAGHSKSDLDLSRGTSGTVNSYYAGIYTTWMDQASGYYFDGVLKFNRFRNDSKVSISDGTRAKGDYDNSGAGGSVEFGRHIKLNDGYFIEPYSQLSAVVIQGKDYELNNDMRAEGDRTRSLLGKVGMTAGRNFEMSDGKVLQPYVRVAGVHEFAKNNEVQVNNNVFNNDLSGSRGELGAGVAVAFSDSLQVHADFDYSNGENIEQPFGANVGLRYSW
ncbi:autotransporter outer membrane beta-barrel domain-containing protein [Pseudomonas sp. CFBP 13711]|uniref:autotransporter outer membrane beta-barrel domain-containing protein n=1 Tax=Pseudomonas sp. CFBP 13715 TaxID=2775306 RepID=UPI0017860AFE|nr:MULTISPECIES: autotransporter outer membrane beta-barrel domain-containing protein [unclassified Pseudomonas]MBD8705571.1 autotransporter outer membrane beta-barrel domain-containing protein [Pseudomonas sp. CFBP 13711]MBD8710730.1 autotransporter outer membrane beta-barrel domain-containing protein [Pseudomonas sp. CFBP 13715]